MKISELLLLSDVDGTLVNMPAPIPTRNIEALTRFTQAGGRFALATGRAVQSSTMFYKQLPVNVPCILYNGAGVYDFAQKKLLFGHYLPEHYLDYAKIVLGAFPQISATVFCEQGMFALGERTYSDIYLADEYMPMKESTFASMSGKPAFKIIFTMSEAHVPAVKAFMDSQAWPDITLVSSSDIFYEMLPLGISKDTGLRHLCEYLHISVANTVAIGDYYNDEMMLRGAGFSATVAAAPEDLKQLCRLVVGDCTGGAVADLIEHLETICE